MENCVHLNKNKYLAVMNDETEKLDVLNKIFLEEKRLNAIIVESVFRYFVLGTIVFGLGIFIYLGLTDGRAGVSGEMMWSIFLLQIILFCLARVIPQHKKFALPFLLLAGFFMGLLIVPYLYFVGNEFGNAVVGRSLVISALLFAAFAIIGWIKFDFMPIFSRLIKYLLAALFFTALVSPFLLWNEVREQLFASLSLFFLSLLVIFDFQKLRYYPERAAISASLHLFMNLALSFVMTLRLLTALNH